MSFLMTFALSQNSLERHTGLFEAIDALIHKDEIISSSFEGEKSTDTWDENDIFDIEDTFFLEKKKDKDFKILSISDPHFSDYDIRAFYAFESSFTVKRLVEKFKPDLILVLGDMVCTESDHYAIYRFTELMDSFKIPWAPVFGNHDDEGNCDLNFLADVMMQSEYCLFEKGDPKLGVGNYVINIAEYEDGKRNVVESFVMMDSKEYSVNEEQVKWFKWVTDGINKATDFTSEISLAEHIPLPEYQYAFDESWDLENSRWKEGKGAYGQINEMIACGRYPDGTLYQIGFFDAVKASGTTKYIFCGHDHLNDASMMYEGIRMSYNMKLGFGSGFKWGFNGGTLITLNSNGIKNISHKSKLITQFMTIENINTQ